MQLKHCRCLLPPSCQKRKQGRLYASLMGIIQSGAYVMPQGDWQGRSKFQSHGDNVPWSGKSKNLSQAYYLPAANKRQRNRDFTTCMNEQVLNALIIARRTLPQRPHLVNGRRRIWAVKSRSLMRHACLNLAREEVESNMAVDESYDAGKSRLLLSMRGVAGRYLVPMWLAKVTSLCLWHDSPPQ